MSRYDVKAIRNQVKKRMKKERDPTEFRPPKVDDGKPVKYRFYILPPLEKGNAIDTGESENSMELFFLENGAHYLDGKRLGCPRVINETECKICDFAFDCIREVKELGLGDEEQKDRIRSISSKMLPGTYRMVNIYFPDGPVGKINPEDLRGKVFWYNAPVTVFDMWWNCLCRDDDGGDPTEPEAFGVFYDEENGYLFQLEINKKGRGNNYEKSKFIVTDQIKAHPIAFKNKKLDKGRIEEILSSRHDLFDKLPPIDEENLKKVTRNLSDGDDSGGSSSGGFSKDEESSTKTEKKDSKKDKGDDDDLSSLEGAGTVTDEAVSGEEPQVDDVGGTGSPADEPIADSSGDDDDDQVAALLGRLTDGD